MIYTRIYYRKKIFFATNLVNVATKEYCSICLKTALISEEYCEKIFVVDAAAEEKRGRIYSKGTFSKTAPSMYVSIEKSDLNMQFSVTTYL